MSAISLKGKARASLRPKRVRVSSAQARVTVHPSAHAETHPNGSTANRARAQPQKLKWLLMERMQWWRQFPTVEMPLLPHPRDKVAEKDMPQAKIQAVEAMQEFGVLVEASRASGMGRWQLAHLVRKDQTPDNDFREDMLRAKRECQERLEGAFIARGMTRGGDLAGIFYQKHNWKKYEERPTRIELTGKDGSPLQAFDAAKAELLQRLMKANSAGSGGSQGLEGLTEIQVGGSGNAESAGSAEARPRLVAGSGEGEVRRAGKRRQGGA